MKILLILGFGLWSLLASIIIRPIGTGGGGGFSPSDISGLVRWYDAQSITGLSDGNSVGSWTDLSSSGLNATQGTGGKQPLYKTGSISTFPSILFDGIDDCLADAGSSTTISTVAIVLKKSSGIPTNKSVLGADGSTGSPWDALLAGNTSTSAGAVVRRGYGAGTSALQATAGSGISVNVRHVWVFTINYASGNIVIDQWVDGVSVGTQASISSQTAIPATFLTYGCGRYNGAETDWWPGWIGEVCVYDNVLGTTDRQDLEDYLGGRWNITITH